MKDPALGRHAGQFVWLSIDVDKPNNAQFLDRFPVASLPTLLVVDPATQTAALKWLGTANVSQLDQLLVDGRRALDGGNQLEGRLAEADRLDAAGQSTKAVAAYRELLRDAPAGWARRGRATESLVLAAAASGDPAACAGDAAAQAPSLARGPSFANTVSTGLSCALDLPRPAPGRVGSVGALETLAREAVMLPGLLADDRAALFSALIAARRDAGDEPGTQAAAARAWEFLEREGKSAPSVEVRASLDGFRVEAAQALEDPARAIPWLERSERDLPGDFNPPARIALVLRDMGNLVDAEAAARRALGKVYGPRRARVLETLGSIQAKRGRVKEARVSYSDALTVLNGVPEARRSEASVERVQRALASLPAAQ